MYINHIMVITMAHTTIFVGRPENGCPGHLAGPFQVVSALVSRRAMAMDYVDGEALSKASERLTQDGLRRGVACPCCGGKTGRKMVILEGIHGICRLLMWIFEGFNGDL